MKRAPEQPPTRAPCRPMGPRGSCTMQPRQRRDCTLLSRKQAPKRDSGW